MRSHIVLLIATAFTFVAACNESEFSSSNSKKENAPPDGDATDEIPEKGGGPSNTDCVDGDLVKLNWTGAAKECIVDQGKTYDFDSQKCAQMRPAKFDCTWDNIISEMKKLTLESTVLVADSEAGAKLVSCGQSEKGNRIVAQWIKAPKDGKFDCSADKKPGGITTGCYTLYGAGEEQPPAPKNADEKGKQVYACLDTL